MSCGLVFIHPFEDGHGRAQICSCTTYWPCGVSPLRPQFSRSPLGWRIILTAICMPCAILAVPRPCVPGGCGGKTGRRKVTNDTTPLYRFLDMTEPVAVLCAGMTQYCGSPHGRPVPVSGPLGQGGPCAGSFGSRCAGLGAVLSPERRSRVPTETQTLPQWPPPDFAHCEPLVPEAFGMEARGCDMGRWGFRGRPRRRIGTARTTKPRAPIACRGLWYRTCPGMT